MAKTFFGCLAAAMLAAALAGCGWDAGPEGPVKVSVIGGEPQFAAVGRAEASAAQATLLASAAQGLVSFDASGRIEPGLAQRWIVSDNGLSYIFRIRKAEWRPGQPVTAAQLARSLEAAFAPNTRNRLAPFFSAVDEVIAVTPEILEIRLKHPRPHFLDLLAQPEMAFIDRREGTGPYRIAGRDNAGIALVPVADPQFPDEQQAQYPVALRAERAALAIARYDLGQADAVLGGTFADLPIVLALNPPPGQLRFDPARGLFGLAVTSGDEDGFLATAENRQAISMAIDREALVAAFAAPGWNPVLSIVPDRLEMPGPPAQPGWAALPLAERITTAQSRVAAWRKNDPEFPRLSIHLPVGPGSRLLFTRLAIDLGRIGIIAIRAPQNGPADLHLIDAVAPNDSATWYLTALSCEQKLPCGEAASAALEQSRQMPTLGERAAKLAEADIAYALDAPFIPIASPIRWSLVRPALNGFRTNNRAAHPLRHLLND